MHGKRSSRLTIVCRAITAQAVVCSIRARPVRLVGELDYRRRASVQAATRSGCSFCCLDFTVAQGYWCGPGQTSGTTNPCPAGSYGASGGLTSVASLLLVVLFHLLLLLAGLCVFPMPSGLSSPRAVHQCCFHFRGATAQAQATLL